MRRDIDYSRYDPDNFGVDHPHDPILSEAKESAQALANRLESAPLEGTAWEQRVQVEQAFDHLESDRWEVQKKANEIALRDHLESFANEKADAAYQDGFERVKSANTRDEQVAAWEGTPQEAADARLNASQDPAYLEEREQLESFQAAQAEAASREAYAVQEEFLQSKGLDKAEPPSNENAALSAYDRVARQENLVENTKAHEMETD